MTKLGDDGIGSDTPVRLGDEASDSVVHLIADAMARHSHGNGLADADRFTVTIFKDAAEAILSALSDAGLAVLPLEATVEMVEHMRPGEGDLARMICYEAWKAGAAAFHPSQLETKQ